MRKLLTLIIAALFTISTGAFAASHAGGKADDAKKTAKDEKKSDKK